MTEIHRSAIVPYSAHRMFDLVADIPSYPQFLPWCSGARIVTAKDDEMIAAIDIAYGGVNKTFSTRNLLQRGKIMEMRLIEGPFSFLQGYWQFTPFGEDASKISLDLEFRVANRLMSLALTPVFSNIANQLVDRFHQRAAELHGKKA